MPVQANYCPQYLRCSSSPARMPVVEQRMEQLPIPAYRLWPICRTIRNVGPLLRSTTHIHIGEAGIQICASKMHSVRKLAMFFE